MSTYYALTATCPARRGWSIIAAASTSAEANDIGLGWIDATPNDIYKETRLKNFRVRSRSRAISEGYIPRDFELGSHPAWQV